MADIKVSDNASLSLAFPAGADSAFMKYMLRPGTIDVELTQKQAPEALIDKLVPCGVKFTTPVKLGSAAEELSIQTGLQGTMRLETGTLFDPKTDDFGDSLSVPGGQAYVSAGIAASLNAGLTERSGDLQFGFSAGSSIILTNHRRFDTKTKVSSALRTLFEGFVIPADLQDVERLAPDAIATVEGSGSLKFSATATLAAATNPLATLAPGSISELCVKPGEALCLQTAVTLTGGYQVRVRRLEGKKFQLGYEKKQGETLAVTASAQAGLTADVHGFDLIANLMKAISRDPVVDKDTFGKQTGLTDTEISAISAAMKAGIDRNLALSISAELDLSAGSTAAFSYEIDLDALDDEAKRAVHSALDGDLEGLEGADHPGVTRLTSVFGALREGKRILKINLLGIFNFGSVTDLIRNGKLIVDRESGAITIADKVTANRIGFTVDHFAKDSAKLRMVLASGVTMTAGYTVGGVIPKDPAFGCDCWSFEFHQNTNRQNIEHYLHVAQALQLMKPADAAAKLASVSVLPSDAFKASTFHVESSYAAAPFEAMFLGVAPGSAQPRSRTEYENLGRSAMATLLPPNDPATAVRLRPLTEDRLWRSLTGLLSAEAIKQELRDQGVTNDPNALADVVSDVLLIFWWAGAMSGMAHALADLLAYLKTTPEPDSENDAFKKLRKALDDSMAAVSSDTQPSFGEPWGLLVMARATGMKDTTTATLVNSRLSFVCHRP
jgi:hypothetical protein